MTRVHSKIYKMFIHLHLLPIVLVPAVLWIISGWHKLTAIITGSAWGPDKTAWIPWLMQHFSHIPLMSHPVIIAVFFIMTALQLAAGIYYLVGIFRLEFIIGRGKQWLSIGTILGIINILILSVGQNIARDDMDVFELTCYFSAHLICLFYINFVTEDFFMKNWK